ncbi:zinc-binding dehydrogenase [Actinoplanes sp. NPDC048796]
MLQDSLDRIAAGTLDLGPVTVYPFERIRDAHRDVEDNKVSGKVVVLVP